jgi:YD repeat-containing protein
MVDMSRIQNLVSVSFVVLVIGVANEASPQSDPLFEATGVQAHRDYFSQLPFEHVDPVSGAVVLTFTDLVLPGSGGRDLVFQRTYNSKGQFGGAPGRWSFGIAGVPLWVEDSWPAFPESIPLLHYADGGAAAAATQLYAGNRSIMMTDRFAKHYRASRITWLPDGTVANYDSSNRLSTVTDPFGNIVISLAYDGQTVTVTQQVAADQSRQVQITMPPNCAMGTLACVPTSMTYLGRTWTYTGGGYSLETVQPPVGPPWRYEYTSSGSTRTLKTITPHGGSVLYTIETIGFPWVDGETFFTDVVRFRDTTDVRGGQSSGHWEYDYDWEVPDLAKASTIIAPDGTATTFEFGFVAGGIAPEYVGRTYLVNRRIVRQGQTEIEREERQYQWVSIPSFDPSVTKLPQLQSRTLTRAGRTYTTTLTYDAANYGDYHQPKTITEVGERTRTTTRTFVHSENHPHFAPYIVGLLASETVEEPAAIGNQTMTSSWTYDAANGFRTSETRAGITTTFTKDGYGNIATITKANGKATSYAYNWGQVSDITTPEHTTTRLISSDGTVTSETTANRTTTYEYDDLGRLTRVRPAGYPTAAAEVVTAYDNVEGATATVSRGSSQIVTTLDGFGRAIAASDTVPTRAVTRYDAQGRVIFQGYPVRSSDPDIGTAIEYLDPLGRETLRTNPDQTFSQRAYGAGTVTITDAANRSTLETWQAFGDPNDARLSTVVDADGKTWTYSYNVAGQLVGVTAQDGIARSWVYNGNLLLDREVHPESGTTLYTYDAAGVLATSTDAKGTVTTYAYDGNDRMRTATAGSVVTTTGYELGSDYRAWTSNGSVTATFVYDTAGRLERRQDAIDGKLFSSRFEYATDDALSAIVYPSGRRIEYARDSEGRIMGVSEPAAGRDHAFGLTYHPSGALQTFTAGNLIQTQIGYDPQRYWVRSITSGTLQLTYDNYDAVGNVGIIGDPRFGAQTFTYDELDRLFTAVGAYGSIGYEYDVHGNRQTGFGSTYQYEPGTLRLTNQNGIPYTYDTRGNLWTAGSSTYTYTSQNRLASAVVTGGTAAYAYDADGQRTKTSFAGSTTYYVRGLNGELLSEWKDPGLASGSIRDFVYAGTRLVSAVDKPTSSDPNNTCGVIVPAGSIVVSAASGQNPCFTFNGTAGRRVSAVMTAVSPATFSSSWSLIIRKPDTSILQPTGGACCGATTAFADTRELPVDGTYTLTVDPSGTASGTVSVTLYDVVHVTGSITANGPAVQVPLTVPGQNGELTFSGTVGQTVSVTMTAVSPATFSGNWYLRIFKPDGSQLDPTGFGFGCCGDSIGIRDAVVLPDTGSYKVVLDPADTRLGTVDVRLYAFAHDTRPIVAGGPSLNVQLASPGQNALLTFADAAGQRVSLRVTNASFSGGPGCDTWVSILKPPDDSEIAASKTCMESGGFMEPITLSATGTHTVFANPQLAVTGNVTLQLYDVTNDVTGSLTVGGAAVPVTINSPGQKASFTFSGTAAQQATVRITGNAMGSTTVTLKKPDGSTATSTKSAAASFNLATQTLVDGTYEVIVDPTGANTGSLNLAVTTP